MSEKKAERRKLRYFGLLLAVGLIVLVIGLLSLPSGMVVALLGAVLSAFGGFGFTITYIKHENSMRATQAGKDNTQVNQTSPVASPPINNTGDIYFVPEGVIPQGKRKHLSQKKSKVTRNLRRNLSGYATGKFTSADIRSLKRQ